MLRPMAVALALTALLALPALADGGERPRDDRREMRHEAMERWDGLNHTQRERGLARAEAHGLFARLAHDNATGQATGGFLSFHLQADAGAIHDVRVRANRTAALVPLLAGVTPSPYTAGGSPVARGAMLRLDGGNVDFTAHNDPSASLTWHAASPTNLTFALAPGLRPVLTDAKEVRITIGATHAHIVSNAGASLRIANATVVASLGAGDSAMVRMHPLHGGEALHDMLAAFRQHRMGAALRIADAGGVAAEDGESTDVQASTKEIRRGRVVLDVSSEQHQGRVLFLTLDNGTFDLARLHELAASLNGTALRLVGKTADVLAAADGAFAAVASDDKKTVTVVVAVPHFSSYALALTQPLPAGSDAGATSASGTDGASRGAPGLGAGALLAVGLALLLARRWA